MMLNLENVTFFVISFSLGENPQDSSEIPNYGVLSREAYIKFRDNILKRGGAIIRMITINHSEQPWLVPFCFLL